jgi:transcriptional regulator with XRE-family HTH domain
MEEFIMSLGETIRNIRKSKGYSIMKVKELTGLSKSTISDLENDKSSPTADTLQKIAIALNVSVDEFFKEDSELTKESEIILPKEYTDKYKVTSRDKKQYEEEMKKANEAFFLNDDLSEDAKKEMLDLMSELFWKAKAMNKRKPKEK